MNKSGYLKIISFILSLVTLAAVFVGCKGNGGDSESDAPLTVVDEDGTPLTVISDGSSEYVIFRSSSANAIERQAALALKNSIKEKLGVSLEIVDESKYGGEKAICVGNVDKDAVKELYDSIWYYDYVITVSGDDLLICGGSAEKIKEAVDRFINEYIVDGITELEIEAALLIEERKTEKKVTVTLGDNKLRDYAVVVSDGVVEAIERDASMLQKHCISNFGFGMGSLLPSSAETPLEIIIGNETSRTQSAELKSKVESCEDNEGLVYFENGKIWLTGKTDTAIREAILTFMEDHLDPTKAQDSELKLSADNKTSSISENSYVIMSYNVLFEGYEKENGSVFLEPAERVEAVLARISKANPDVLGVQECTEFWYEALCEALGDEYDSVGEKNTTVTGQRWRNAIFYRKDKFELLDTKTYWLSKTPTVQSKHTTSSQYRIMTYAVLRDKATGETFAHVNTHLGLTAEARSYHYEYLLGLLDKINYPLLVTGDFNTTRKENTYAQMQDAGYYDARATLKEHSDTSAIDYVFVSYESVHVTGLYSEYEKINDIFPSDHPAVVATFCLR